jgi:hypothetical protein
MALCHRDVRTCMPLRYHSAGLCRNHLFTSEMTSSSSSNFFQRTEKMVVGRSQMWAVRWMRQDSPLRLCDGLSVMQTCVWPHIVLVKKHFMGTNPPEMLFQSFHIDVRVDRLASGLSAHCIVSGITAVDGQPKHMKSDTLSCPCSQLYCKTNCMHTSVIAFASHTLVNTRVSPANSFAVIQPSSVCL